MPDTLTSVSESGFATENRFEEHVVEIDSKEEQGPNPTATLLGAYASCYVVGLRIAARERGYTDLGEIRIEVTGQRDSNGDVGAIDFSVRMSAAVNESDMEDIVDQALSTCHVGNALRSDLQATVTIEDS